MGYYISKDSKGTPLPVHGKANALLADGGQLTDGKEFVPNLVCVADRYTHDAAIYLYSHREYEHIRKSNEGEEECVVWLTHPSAKELSGYE